MLSMRLRRIRRKKHKIGNAFYRRMDKDMKNKIKNIVLGIMLMCSVLVSSVNVQATELSSAESAVVDIESYQVIEGALNPGEQITLEIVVKNNSFVSDSQNTVMTLESINGTLAPVYGEDNQIYIGTIPANGTARVQVSAVVNKQYNADAAQMVCYFNYVSKSSCNDVCY